ncbi:MAG: EamA family transporter [Legionellales bacterium]|nr:EamA family transporter [Legionellales bacterium]
MLVENKKEELAVFALSISFIVLYGSGFVGSKLGFPYAKPLTFLVLRFGITALLLLLIAFFVKAKWPKSWMETAHIAIISYFVFNTALSNMQIAGMLLANLHWLLF